MEAREVLIFSKPGKGNTTAAIEAVGGYLDSGGEASAIVVASISGDTALRLRKKIQNTPLPIVCIAGAPCWWRCYPSSDDKPISTEAKTKLVEAGVLVVNSVPSPLADTIESSLARYGYRSPSFVFMETLLMVGGYGFKTAVECVLMATDGGFIEPFKDVIAVAGTAKGADTAIVVRSTFSPAVFSANAARRMVVREILAMPRNRVYYRRVGYGETWIEETCQPVSESAIASQ